ncbi:MAG TPA: peroxiredoxin [Candidatus Nanopelagicales bacterium]|jgi:peroxiredoxin Q/BCP|nr:peroxiredoxin [Candidatus Nanopelagicales bacterium]
MALLAGAIAPDFVLTGWYDGRARDFRLSEHAGRPRVLAFYPGDERLVCTRQLCAYSDGIEALHRARAAQVWAISPQDVHSHREFAQRRSLALPLLADTASVVAQMYQIVGPFGLRRSVFIIDESGRIAWRWVAALNLTFPGVGQLQRVLDGLGHTPHRQ